MNITQIENNLKELVDPIVHESFIFDLLLAYKLPKASISRLQKGNLNLSNIPGEVSWKKKLFFKEEFDNDLHLTISALKTEIKHNQRFIIVTDYQTLLAVDTHTQDQLDIPIKELPKYYDFFLPWAGMEKATHAAENPADVKAAEKMAKLFDEIKKDNPDTSAEFIHNLNIFFSRLLFCYFAEDTNIFEEQQFSYAIQSHTKSDGADLNSYLDRLFWVLNMPVDKRGDIPHYLNAFPYVNGGLFKEDIPSPKFSAKSRQLLIDSGDSNDWSAINPDIFGSMFQAVISPEHRGGLGAHYTSVPNIMKVIEPLFLNDLKEAFEDAVGNEKKLKELLLRISKIKLFDPACGSGNFLIIAYKELRRLEMRILKELGELVFSGIHLNNFYGIELDDFAHEIAKLSLWLAEHQMNVEFFNEFGRTNPTLPLQEAGQIVCGNACRLDWEMVCPKNEGDEIYILGNPPYLGYSVQSQEQKYDMSIVFKDFSEYKSLDYISCWILKGARYIKKSNTQFAFVSTNSICQGEQVSLLWPSVINEQLEISFAHTSFKWTNSAKQNAGVSVIIIGVRNELRRPKYLFKNGLKLESQNINGYLIDAQNIYIQSRKTTISELPRIGYGSSALDGGFLIFSKSEINEIINQHPQLTKYFKKIIGSQELIKGIERYCLWIDNDDLDIIGNNPFIKSRLDLVKQFRLTSKRQATFDLASNPHRFGEARFTEGKLIIIPKVSSENRQYLPLGFFEKDVVVMDKAFPIYNPETYVFSILSSRMHIIWLNNVGGKLKMDFSYSSSLVYNTFPFPPISTHRKEELTQCTFRILEEREKHPEKTLAQLYDPDKMPEGLKEAHRLNDEAVARCYRSTPFNSDEERLEYLFKLYEKMIQEEKEKGTLFEVEKKTKKKK
jgi:type I restriction-modification system DNA methylase subunit